MVPTRLLRIPTLIGCGTLLWCTAAGAGDWQPSAAAPLPAGTAAEAPLPGYPAPPQMRGRMPPAPGFGPSPGARAGIDQDPETGRISFDFAGLGVVQQRTDDAYLLQIDLRGLPPEQVEIRPLGQGLMIAVRRTAETTRQETAADGQGYRRSWSYASGQRAKRLPAPPDADLAALERQATADAISIRIPRRGMGLGAVPMPGEPLPPARSGQPPAPPAPAAAAPEAGQ
jgi:HSP20 family molecular chaperone IbpA